MDTNSESSAHIQELKNAIDNYMRVNDIEALREFIEISLKDNLSSETIIIDLVTLAKIDSNAAKLAKELVNSQQVDDTKLANQISKEIISDIEESVDHHLEKYQKYTLDAPPSPPSSSQFFNLISLLKDVSILGRKLLESAPQFNAQKKIPPPTTIKAPPSPRLSDDRKASPSAKSALVNQGKTKKDEDTTSEDLLAALIESSSSDDFLVLSSSLDSISTKDMIVAALIYIKSHDCFTLSHDIQGVVMVLRRTKFIIVNILAPKNQMELITKLLTSIGRYNEMNYVFDLFRDRNQFEILLSKGVEKTPELRIALFNYVKKNPEFYALVTLNFSMFREIAESLEASAIKRINKLIATRQANETGVKQQEIISSLELCADNSESETPTTLIRVPYPRESLNLCLIELVDASDCFAKAGCYKKSNHCERQAKLIALQLSILDEGKNVLALTQSESNDLIVNSQLFADAYIIAEAYDCHLAWRQALFKNVILNGDLGYLQDYCKRCDLSSNLVEELVVLYKKYISSHQLSQEEISKLAKSMKAILVKLNDVELKCKIYSQLNFDDAKEELLRDAAVQAHLKDLKLV